MDSTLVAPPKFRPAQPISSDLLKLWTKTIWGTERTLYQIPDEHSFPRIPEARGAEMWLEDRLIGGIYLLQKSLTIGGIPSQACYQGLMAIEGPSQGSGYGRQLLESVNTSLRQQNPPPRLLYAYFESDNIRSQRLFQSLGYQKIGGFFSTAFCRFNPKDSVRVSPLTAHQKPMMLHELGKLYAGHAFNDFQSSLDIDHYYVLRDENRILAGVQAERQKWTILSLAGAGGWLARKLLPLIPYVRDVFNPDDFQFLKMSHLYIDPEQPEALTELLEAVLFRYRMKTAIMFLDEHSPVFKRFSEAVRLGFLNPLTRTEVIVMGLPLGPQGLDLDLIRGLPLTISPSDP